MRPAPSRTSRPRSRPLRGRCTGGRSCRTGSRRSPSASVEPLRADEVVRCPTGTRSARSSDRSPRRSRPASRGGASGSSLGDGVRAAEDERHRPLDRSVRDVVEVARRRRGHVRRRLLDDADLSQTASGSSLRRSRPGRRFRARRRATAAKVRAAAASGSCGEEGAHSMLLSIRDSGLRESPTQRGRPASRTSLDRNPNLPVGPNQP